MNAGLHVTLGLSAELRPTVVSYKGGWMCNGKAGWHPGKASGGKVIDGLRPEPSLSGKTCLNWNQEALNVQGIISQRCNLQKGRHDAS